jgi:hypothetical protein
LPLPLHLSIGLSIENDADEDLSKSGTTLAPASSVVGSLP